MNDYIPFPARVLSVQRHTEIEYTFRFSYNGEVKPGQFFEVSVPKYGEAPISISGYGAGWVEMTIRKVGKVTGEVFKRYEGDIMFLRGPFGNGFDLELYRNRELLVVSGGTGAAPVRGVIKHFADHPERCKSLTVLASFKRESEILFKEDFERWSATANILLTMTRDSKCEKYLTGRVTQHISDLEFTDVSSAAAIVVGPSELMRATADALIQFGFREENIWISEERKMCCGLGKCGHCRVGKTYICLDGPVFNYSEGKMLMD